MPVQQQRDADLGRQLDFPPVRRLEQHHGMEHQHHGEQIDACFVGNDIVVVQQAEGGKCQQRGAESDGAVACQARQRQIRQGGGSAEEREHEDPGGGELGREIPLEGRGRQPDQHERADREAVVRLVANGAVRLLPPLQEHETGFGRQVGNDRHVLGGVPVGMRIAVEDVPVVGEQPRGGKRQQQAASRQPPRKRRFPGSGRYPASRHPAILSAVSARGPRTLGGRRSLAVVRTASRPGRCSRW